MYNLFSSKSHLVRLHPNTDEEGGSLQAHFIISSMRPTSEDQAQNSPEAMVSIWISIFEDFNFSQETPKGTLENAFELWSRTAWGLRRLEFEVYIDDEKEL